MKNKFISLLSVMAAAVIMCISMTAPVSASGESLKLTSVKGAPGETVKLDLMVTCNNNFESLDVVMSWKDKALKCSRAVAVNPAMGASDSGDGYVTAVIYGSDAIPDGSVAEVYFTIPQDAKDGTVYNIDFEQIKTFAIFEGDDLMDKVPHEGGTITVSGTAAGGNSSGNNAAGNNSNANNAAQTEKPGDNNAAITTVSSVTTLKANETAAALSDKDTSVKATAQKATAKAADGSKTGDKEESSSAPVFIIMGVVLGAAVIAALVIVIKRKKQ